MNSRERILSTLQLKEPDRVPVFDSLFKKEWYEEFLGHRPDFYDTVDCTELAAILGMDATLLTYDGYPGVASKAEPERYESEWGVIYQRTDMGWPGDHSMEFKFNTPAALDQFRPPDPNAPWRMDRIKRGVDTASKYDLAVITAIRGPFAHAAWHFIGMMEICVAILTDTDFVSRAVRLNTDFNKEVCTRMANEGCDVFWITEDLGSNNQPLINPMQYRELFLPHLREVVQHIRSLGKVVVLHSDGYIMPYLPDLVGTGINGLNPLQRSAKMKIDEVKQLYGDRICIVGNVDNYNVMELGTPEQVEALAKECIRAAAKGGGHILASDHTLHEGCSLENAKALIESVHKWGTYPLTWIETEEASHAASAV
ncbi:MAG TPA: uroporphyrinogen decarboxylase family protein [Anaerolineae bacterium]|nr:uroporphyrinogen decarboxylase family protein [Anaerolineae bacterium]